MQWEDVVGWYLEKKEDDLQTEEDLDAEEAIVNKVGYLCGFVWTLRSFFNNIVDYFLPYVSLVDR